MNKFFQFLGSIKLAIILIGLTALFVAAGTFLEAYTDSHLFSASLTYHSPIFLALIWGFFLNILVSALRRWPFQAKHIPFLTTHLGLLMLLGGVIIKSHFGVQGSMGLIEGGSSKRIFLPDTQAIHVEKRDSTGRKIQMDLPFKQVVKQKANFDEVELRLVDYAPHSHERRQSWIKNHHTYISGLKPLPVVSYSPAENYTLLHKARFHHEKSMLWNVLALSTNQVAEAAKQIYLQGLIVKISDSSTGETLSQMPLVNALSDSIKIADKHKLAFNLVWNFSFLTGLESPALSVDVNNEKMLIALNGTDSLINRNLTSPYRGKLPITIDLQREPVLLLIQDEQEDDHLFFFNSYGEIHSVIFKNDTLPSLVVYDDGFGGYAVHTPFPFCDLPCSRHDKEQAELLRLAVQLRQSLEKNPELSPPLQLLKQGMQVSNADFTATVLQFLHTWEASSQFLLSGPLPDLFQPIIQHMDWNKITLHEQYACGWLCALLEEMREPLQSGKSFSAILEERGWPFAHQFTHVDENDTDAMITLFAQQLFAAATELPRPPVMPSMISAKALSAYLRAYGITLNHIRQPIENDQALRTYHAARIYNDRIRKIFAPLDQQHTSEIARLINFLPENSLMVEEITQAYLAFQRHLGKTEMTKPPSIAEMSRAFQHYAPLEMPSLSEDETSRLIAGLNTEEVILETPLTLVQKKMPALQKWEDNHPFVTLEIKKGSQKEYCSLTYDKYGTGLAWPVLNGEYVLRYQPIFIEIPYQIRLHDARQINYPGTQQPYSYESDIIVTDLKNQSRQEKTISMNNVYETASGYRFYLASLSPPQEVSAQRIQIVVNYDPAKYILTYPGAFIMSLGILLLFWMRPYSKG